MLALALVVTPVAIILFHFDLSAAPLGFAKVMALGILGFAAVGTLFSAAVSSTRLQGGLLALLVFPLCLPLVLASTQILIAMFSERPDGSAAAASGGTGAGGGVAILIAFDVIFLVASWLASELLLEP
jgi:heme exporter protein B